MSDFSKDEVRALVSDAGSSPAVQEWLNKPVTDEALNFASAGIIDSVGNVKKNLLLLSLFVDDEAVRGLLSALIKDLNAEEKLWAGVQIVTLHNGVNSPETKAVYDAAREIDPERFDEVLDLVADAKQTNV
jgi:hypothetical protein